MLVGKLRGLTALREPQHTMHLNNLTIISFAILTILEAGMHLEIYHRFKVVKGERFNMDYTKGGWNNLGADRGHEERIEGGRVCPAHQAGTRVS